MENKKAPHQRSIEQALRGMHGKYNKITNQKEIFAQFLKEHTATATMSSVATGIPQKNICRYKRELEDEGRLVVLFKRLCPITKFRAAYLSTNPDLINPSNPNVDE